MKNIAKLFFVTFFLSIVFNISAQKSLFSFGFKAGVNVSNLAMDFNDIYYNTLGDKELKVGFNVGVTAEYFISESFAVQSGLSYTTKGASIKGKERWIPSGETHSKYTINLEYLQIPLLGIYKINIAPDSKVFFNAGPYIAYGIGGKITKKNKYVDLDSPDDKEKMNSFGDRTFKKFDFGLIGGVGAEYERFVLTLDYELGLMDIARRDDKIFHMNSLEFRNRNVSLSFGYKL